MNLGFLDSLVIRSRSYWMAYLKELGLKVITPELPESELLALGKQSLPNEPVTVQLALGRILELGRLDTVLVPRWQVVGGDAWGEALAELLPRRIAGLPQMISIPDGGPDMEQVATELGLQLVQNPAVVRRAMEKTRMHLQLPKMSMPSLSRASRTSVGVIGPRALLGEEILMSTFHSQLEALGLYGIYSHQLSQDEVLKRSERMDNLVKASQGERELFGAASLLAGKGAVRGLIFVSPARDGHTNRVQQRIAQKLHKASVFLEIDAPQEIWPELPIFKNKIEKVES